MPRDGMEGGGIVANISFDPKEIKPLLQSVGLGDSPATSTPDAPTPQMTQGPDAPRPDVAALPPPPPKPIPAQAGFNAWSTDPQNQVKVAGGITPPGQPLVPPTAAAQLSGIAPLAAAAAPISQADDMAAHPDAYQTASLKGRGWGRTLAVGGVAALQSLAGGLTRGGDPLAGMGYLNQQMQHDEALPQTNAAIYDGRNIKPLRDAAALTNAQSEARIHAVQANQAENPGQAAPEYDYVDGPNGKVAIQKGTTNATPVTLPGGAPLGAKVEAPKTPLELALRDNPKLSATEWDAQQQHPISKQEADTLNATWNPILAKHGLPLNQIKEGQPRAEATAATTAFNNAVGKQQGDTRVTIVQQAAQQRQALAMQRTGALDLTSPEAQATLDEGASGNVALSELLPRGATFGQRAALVAALTARNPNYNSGDHAIENGVRRYMTSGQGGSTITAGNTLTHHLDLYDKAVDDVHNGNLKAVNALGNEMGIQMGNDAQTNLALVRQGVAMEAARYYTGGVPGEKEIDQFNNNLSGDGSPGQMHGGANTVRAMAAGKLKGLKDQATAGAHGQAAFNPAPNAGGISVTAPDGSIHPFATQAQADAFKKLAGIR